MLQRLFLVVWQAYLFLFIFFEIDILFRMLQAVYGERCSQLLTVLYKQGLTRCITVPGYDCVMALFRGPVPVPRLF